MSECEFDDREKTISALESVVNHTYDPELRAVAEQKMFHFFMLWLLDNDVDRKTVATIPKTHLVGLVMAFIDEMNLLRRVISEKGLQSPASAPLGTDKVANHDQ